MVEKEGKLEKEINWKHVLINIAIRHCSMNLEHFFIPKHLVIEEFLVEDANEIQLIRMIIDFFLNHHFRLLNSQLHSNSTTIRQIMSFFFN